MRSIARLTDAEIVRGLVNLDGDNRAHPANRSEFIAACKRTAPVRQLGVPLLPMSDTEKQANADKSWDDMERLAGRSLRPE